MYPTHRSRRNQAVRRSKLRRRQYRMFPIAMFSLIILALLLGFRVFKSEAVNHQQNQQVIALAPPMATAPKVIPLSNPPTRDPYRLRIGVVSGHRGYDPGAVCNDGLTEADVNYIIATEVVKLLERRGIQIDLLEEYDERLTEYQADALVSIHADSCNIPGATGFKVASVTDSAIPEAEEALVRCLNQQYAAHTGLSQHPASITDNMTNYHAFREIAPTTPGAIIETGFLLDDRQLLEQRPKVVARGIASGIVCFLEQEPYN